MARTIMVKPGDGLAPGEIALWEVHGDHPNGEVLIAKPHPGEEDKSYRVARTLAVQTRLSDGRLMQPGRRNQDEDEDEEVPAPVAPASAQAPARRGASGG